MPNSLWPHGSAAHQAPRVHGILQARILEWDTILSNPEIEPTSPALQADFLPSEPPGNDRLWIITKIMSKWVIPKGIYDNH